MKNFRLLNITIFSILLILFFSLLVLKHNLMVIKKNDTVNYSETFSIEYSSKIKNGNNWLQNYSLKSHLKRIKLYKMNKSYYFENYEKDAKDRLLNKNSLDYAKSDETLSFNSLFIFSL